MLEYTGDAVTPSTINLSDDIIGNYTWFRVRLTNFVAGTITKVTVSY